MICRKYSHAGKKDMIKHMKALHNEGVTHDCTTCEYTVKSQLDMKQHRQKHETENGCLYNDEVIFYIYSICPQKWSGEIFMQ